MERTAVMEWQTALVSTVSTMLTRVCAANPYKRWRTAATNDRPPSYQQAVRVLLDLGRCYEALAVRNILLGTFCSAFVRNILLGRAAALPCHSPT
jgi:hypothetical protein